ncbi:biopolymer transporter [Verrucomicrobia bacterium IMCC26134]|jgi:biopolymer transport protein ExbB|nr:biopolymer transporter [Verrucomicrobia bacterium IMCC26134]
MKRVLVLVSFAAATPFALLAQAAAVAPEQAHSVSLLKELSSPFIMPLWACSALIVYLVIDLYLKTASKQFIPPADIDTLRTYFRAGDYHGAYAWTAANSGSVAEVVHAGIMHSTGGKTASEDAMGAAIIGENSKFQNKIAYLSVIGVIAPMVGLTGTVVGMIQAFAAMGQAGAADPSKLSGAIGHVLHATASGLAVAIPAFVFYYLLRNRVSHQIHELSLAVNDLFRCYPYEHMKEVAFEGGEHVAATPNWVTGAASVDATSARG